MHIPPISLLLACAALLPTLAAMPTDPNSAPTAPSAIHLPLSGRGSSRVAYLGEAMDRLIADFMAQENIPGMTLAIVQAPYIPRVVGYGLADAEKGWLASTKTLWPMAMISQAFGAVAAFQLVESGKLDLNAPIGNILPGLPDSWRPVTVLQLLQHASGLPDYTQVAGYDPARDLAPGELLATAYNTPPTFEPGTQVAMNPTDGLLLSLVIDRAAGMSYEDYIRRHQFEPLGLSHTTFAEDVGALPVDRGKEGNPTHESFKSDVRFVDPAEPASGYRLDGSALQPVLRTKGLRGYADIWSTPEEISFWDICLAGSILVKEAAHRDIIYKPALLANGRHVRAMSGWQFPHHKGLMDIKGSVPGYSAYICRFTDPSELVCVTLTCNREGVDLTNLARRIAGALDPKLGSGSLDDNCLYLYESVHDVPTTMARLQEDLKRRGIPVFATFDHGRNAREAGLEMPPSQVIVFGSPKVGTHLMLQNPGVAAELPLRIAVWQDEHGSVWVSSPRLDKIAACYGLQDAPALPGMTNLVHALISHAANAY